MCLCEVRDRSLLAKFWTKDGTLSKDNKQNHEESFMLLNSYQKVQIQIKIIFYVGK